MPTVQQKEIVFTHHALERGLQVGFNEDQLYASLAIAQRIKGDNVKKLLTHHYPGKRYYRCGSTVFITQNTKDQLIVITVWDDIFPRNEGFKLPN